MKLLIRNTILDDREIPIETEVFLIGRDAQSHLKLVEASVSRFHARLERQADASVVLADLGSSNGTFVNAVRIQEPTAVNDGDTLRFGTVDVVFLTEAPAVVLPPSTPAAKGLPTPLLVVGIGVLVVIAASAMLVWSDGPAGSGTIKDPRDDISTPLPSAPGEAGAAGVPPAAEPPLEGETLPSVPTPPEEGAAAPPTETTRPEPPPAPVVHRPQFQTIRLRDKAPLRARILDATRADTLVLVTEDQEVVVEVPREDILDIDGIAQNPDLPAIFAARFASAQDIPRLAALCDWCRRFKLEGESKTVAQALLTHDAEHPTANEILGRFRVRGIWTTKEALLAANLLDQDGRPAGTDADLFEIRRLTSDLLGRPPYASEVREFLSLPRALILDRLLQSPEHWTAWFADVGTPVLGFDAWASANERRELAKDVAQGTKDPREFFKVLAKDPTLRLKHPEPGMLAGALLQLFLGPASTDDANLVQQATRMLQGERVALFGERGTNADELVAILMKQPAHYRGIVDALARRHLGRELTREEGSKATFRIASAPRKIVELVRDWILSPEWTATLAKPKRKDDRLYYAGAFVDLFGKPPTLEQWQGLEPLTSNLRAPDGLRATAVALIGRAESLDAIAVAPEETGAWIRQTFRRILARAPSADELLRFQDALSSAKLTASDILRAMLIAPEYGIY